MGHIVTDYKKMYLNLAGAVANVIELLTDAQREREEEYVSANEIPINIFTFRKETSEDETR